MRYFLKVFEQLIVIALLIMMVLVVLVSTIDLGWLLIKDLIMPPTMLIEVNQLLDLFGFFLLVLIGLELLEIMKAYLNEEAVPIQIVLEVAMIAIARKIIILDIKELPGLTVIGIAAIVVALAVAFYFANKLISPVHSKSLPKRKEEYR